MMTQSENTETIHVDRDVYEALFEEARYLERTLGEAHTISDVVRLYMHSYYETGGL